MRPKGSSPSSGIILLIVALVGVLAGIALAATRVSYILSAALLALGSLALIAGIMSVVRARGAGATLTSATPPLAPMRPAAPVTPPRPAPVAVPVVVATPPPVAAVPVTPTAPPTTAVPRILPAPGPLFVGREQELDHLIASVRRARGGTVSAVVGPAGAGKHTLIMRAIEAHQEEGTFPDGYSWHAATDYAGDMGLRRLLIEVLDRFGGPAVAMTTTMRIGEAAVADLVRGQRILFWLDDLPNDFPIGRAISALTARDANGVGPTLILSSRADWDIPEISELTLDVPQLDEALDLLREWMDVGGRAPDPDVYDALKAICVNLSSLPLALRLAAGYAAQSGVKMPKLAADLGSAVYPPGDFTRTADKTIAFVEGALFPQPRRAFAALAVFEKPVFDLDAACVVAAAISGGSIDTTQADLESMVRLGLLEPDGSEAQPQLRMHPLVKHYVTQRLAALGPDVAAVAHAAFGSVMQARRPVRADSASSEDESAIWQASQTS